MIFFREISEVLFALAGAEKAPRTSEEVRRNFE
jgi:hypothetical protein